ncbi:MAG: N-acetylmuramoyl-L-alanine amidase [Clostridiales bacterium]|nr:N-acetylmuramoyl-L-alanine amidase [Clostridiales bacterium]
MRILKQYLLTFTLAFGAVMAIAIFIVQQAVPVTADSAPVQIILDAGHGGEDGGASTASGVPESQINLEVALRMEDLFALVGQPVQMVRREDVSIYSAGAQTLSQKKVSDLKNRVEMINDTQNALLISIHQNTYTDSKYHGAQVFYAATADSEALGTHLQAQLAAFLDPANLRKAKEASKSIYLMQNIQCTGVLVECGFLSNPQEAAKLQEESYQKQLSAVLVGGVAAYLEGKSEESEV